MTWAVAAVEDPRLGLGVTLALLRNPGSIEPCGKVRI